jgi:hypothetical protein
VIILPLGLLFALVVSMILVWTTVGMSAMLIAIPAVLLLFCCIFLIFSIFWTTAIVISLAALFTWGASHKGGTALLVALLIEFFALAVVCGGLGLGIILYNNNVNQLFPGLTGSHDPTWPALLTCSQYYDYFTVDPGNRPWDADPTQNYHSYCSEGWYTYLGLVSDIVVTCQIIMITATGVVYLRGGAAKTV